MQSSTVLESGKCISLVKYFTEGITVMTAAYFLTNKITNVTILALGVVATCTLMVLDHFAPTITTGTCFGSDFYIGQNLTGGSNCINNCAKTKKTQLSFNNCIFDCNKQK